MFINLEDVTVDEKYQSRMSTNEEKVQAYAVLMKEGAKFPPVEIIEVDHEYVLVDGFHRFHAAKSLGEYEIESTITPGTWRDVKLRKWQANVHHGMPLTAAERNRSIKEMLDDPEFSDWSDRQIAKHVGSSHVTVWKLRNKSVAEQPEQSKPDKVLKMNTSKAETKAVAEPAEEEAPDDQQVMIETLLDENEKLTKQLAVSVLPEEEKVMAAQLIDDLRAEISLLKVELQSMRESRDRYQWENAELKKQVAAQQKQLKKLQG